MLTSVEKSPHAYQKLIIYDVARFYVQQVSKVNRQKVFKNFETVNCKIEYVIYLMEYTLCKKTICQKTGDSLQHQIDQ